MRLSKIKLSGFKSFVDPTLLHLPSSLVGVVGPNGCGKSNVIDAVRWVMGEISAKSLRGDSMTDVIFNGSSTRKPVGQAMVEIVFDNSDHSLGGQYAAYSEIAIKREVSRDGQSSYYLNGARCRRRDVIDVFLGTGLGPHSYAIIEQGMISRLIEAKPEDLRVFLEEAAGISKYKERRRETETRIAHTRENLARLNDVRGEIEKQLERLQRQSSAAQRYQRLKEEERRLKAELLALRLRGLQNEGAEQSRAISGPETELEAALAKQREIEAGIEKLRAGQDDIAAHFNGVQARFYNVGAEIARVEQAIQHAKERREQSGRDLEQAGHALRETGAYLEADRARITELNGELAQIEPALHGSADARQAADTALNQAEQAMRQWQDKWEAHQEQRALLTQAEQVERTRLEHLQQQHAQLQQRLERLQAERETLPPAAIEQDIQLLDSEHAEQQRQLQRLQQDGAELQARITQLRESIARDGARLQERRSALEQRRAELTSLSALQQAALGKGGTGVAAWLAQQGLQDAPRLAEGLEVESGWEDAVEAVLHFYLGAVCVHGLQGVAAALAQPPAALAILDLDAPARAHARGPAPALLDKVRAAPARLDALLGHVYTAESLTEALTLTPRMQTHESVITRDGLWLGNGWLRVAREEDASAGVLWREHELKQLAPEVRRRSDEIAAAQRQLDAAQEELAQLERRREAMQEDMQETHRAHGDVQAQLRGKQTHLAQLRTRHEQIQNEIEELQLQSATVLDDVHAAQRRLREAESSGAALTQQGVEQARERDAFTQVLEQARQAARGAHEEAHQLALREQSLRAALSAAGQGVERMQQQLRQLEARQDELRRGLTEGEAPLAALRAELQQWLMQRAQAESDLARTRAHLEEHDQSLRGAEQERHRTEQVAQENRALLETLRLKAQELKVRAQGLQEQIREAGHEPEALLQELDGAAHEAERQTQLDGVTQKIQRLGPINLAAIEEFNEQSERKNYLDAQCADLNEALATLEEAIRKIDRETRARFKATYDKVNDGFKTLFPRLFGGGQAYLEMTGDDLLNTGVTVMARPPGKRNSTIHLLSGGEKALIAVALIFSIFELNPAPFCMLDEVDAPLDEANVGRFCELVNEMSKRIQFIIVTHNKVTMEMVNQLIGVTMQEAGVSRLVAVDIDEAVQLAAM